MTWRTTLSVPLFSAALTITVPAVAQDDAPGDDAQRGGERPMTDRQGSAQQAADMDAAERPTGELGQLTPGDQTDNGDAGEWQHARVQPQFEQASRILSMGVRSSTGETLGHISEIVIDPQLNDIRYVVLTVGETMGVGGRMHAVPWQAFSPGAQQQTLVLNISQQQLGAMKGFDADNWPDAGNHAFTPSETAPAPGSASEGAPGSGAAADREQPAVRGEADDRSRAAQNRAADRGADMDDEEAVRLEQQQLREQALKQGTVITPLDRDDLWSHRATKLIGLTIRDAQEADLGTIDDLIVETRRGKVAYVVVAYGGTLGIGDNRAIVPWTALKLNKQEQVATLDTNTRTLDQLAFEGEDLPDMTDQRWVSRTHRAFGQEPDAEVFGYSIRVDDEQPREQRQAPPTQGDQAAPSRPDRPSREPTTPRARDAEREDRPPAREPSTPSTGDMQGQ